MFFLIGVFVFVGSFDFEGMILFGIPLIMFGAGFCITFKKYLKIINFNINNFWLKWKNSKFLRMTDLVLSCLSYIFVIGSLNYRNSLLVVSLISTLIFGTLYIIKPLLNNKLDFTIIKNNWAKIAICTILFITISILSNYYLELRLDWGIHNFDLELLETFESGLEKIIFFIFYGIFKLAFRQGLIIILAILIYLSLVLYINDCLNYHPNIEKKFRILNICELCLFVIILIIHNNIIIKSLWLIILNVFVFGMLITNIIKKHKETPKSDYALF